MPEAPMPQDAAESTSGDAMSEVNALGQGLASLAEKAAGSNLSDSAKQKLATALEAFQAFAAEASGAEEGAESASPEQGVSTPEQGASGAMPMSPGRRA
jgi:hypothetical protein